METLEVAVLTSKAFADYSYNMEEKLFYKIVNQNRKDVPIN